MQIIIPMSGFGERFYRAGYTIPKALIEIESKPIIAHVIDMFPGEHDFLFICNEDHLQHPNYHMQNIIRQYCPTGRIVGIPPHKLGPVHAVLQVNDLIDSNRPVMINYCDFTCYWDWQDFKTFVITTGCHGAIPAYKGFHPHTLGHTNYAYMREDKGWVLDIQEKKPFTINRMNEYASSGSYYFATGKIMEEALRAAMIQELTVGGEYYVSLAYKPLLETNHAIAVYPLQHFMQWGTPEDVKEYENWSAIFRHLMLPIQSNSKPSGAVVIPMAGLGMRFTQEGYTTPKPMIPVSGKPMVVQATNDLPFALYHTFVLRQDMPGFQTISDKLKQTYPNSIIKIISKTTEGQACTALIGLDALEEVYETSGPITFGACDNGMIYNKDVFQTLVNNPEIDVIVWGVRNHVHAARHPEMYGWIDAKNGLINQIAVKQPLTDPTNDPIVLGTFTFRHANDFRRVLEHLIARDGRVNGEFYLDSCINDAIALGLRCYLFEVDHFLSWGTPNDLRTFEYWQSCFHKWPGHPYRLELDSHVATESLPVLKQRYQAITPSLLEPHHDYA